MSPLILCRGVEKIAHETVYNNPIETTQRHISLFRRILPSTPIFNILCKKVMIFNTLKNVVALQTLIFRIFMRPLVGGLKRIQTIVLRRFRAGGAIGIAW